MTYRFVYLMPRVTPDARPIISAAMLSGDLPTLHLLGMRLREDEHDAGVTLDGMRAGDAVPIVHEAMGRAPASRITRTLLIGLLWMCATYPDATLLVHGGE